MDSEKKPHARRAFRILAGGIAVVFFLLAAAARFAPLDFDATPAFYACTAVGVVMSVICLTGRWPW